MEMAPPRARRTDVVVEPVEAELVVYDRARDRAHRLNASAALVWRHADGQRSVADLASVLRHELDPHADDDLVWVALDRLAAAHLLDTPVARPADAIRASRRAFVRKVGLVGALALLLPTVTTIIAPSRAEATHTCSCGLCCDCSTCSTSELCCDCASCGTCFPNCFSCQTCHTCADLCCA